MRHTTKYLLALSTTALLASACNPQISGEEGNLGLTYEEGPVGGAGASSPLAVGAMLDYAAYPEDDKEQRVTFSSATSDDDKIIRVDQVDGGLMTLEGVADGEATVDVEAEGPDGAALTDSFGLEAATVDALEFDNPCAKDEEAVYLVDHDIRLHYTMRAGGTIAVGYGHYPVEITPAEGATVGSTTINGLLPLRTGMTAGEVTVSSSVDDTEFGLTLAEEGDIDGLEIFEDEIFNDGNYPAAVGVDLSLHLLPTVSGLIPGLTEPAPVCQADVDVEATTSTPDVCEVAYGPRDQNDEQLFHLYETNALTITGKTEGTCEISLSIPGANDAAGVTETLSVEIAASSDDQQDDGQGS
jgi:hypothetical protein